MGSLCCCCQTILSIFHTHTAPVHKLCRKYSVRSKNKFGKDVTEIGESRLENLTQSAIISEEKFKA